MLTIESASAKTVSFNLEPNPAASLDRAQYSAATNYQMKLRGVTGEYTPRAPTKEELDRIQAEKVSAATAAADKINLAKPNIDEADAAAKAKAEQQIRVSQRLDDLLLNPAFFTDVKAGKYINSVNPGPLIAGIKSQVRVADGLITNRIWDAVVILAKNNLSGRQYKNLSEQLSPLDDGRNTSRFYDPVTKVSFREIELWLMAVNELSALGNPVLKRVFNFHDSAARYRVPNLKEWVAYNQIRGNDVQYPETNTTQEFLGNFKESTNDTNRSVIRKNPVVAPKEAFSFRQTKKYVRSNEKTTNVGFRVVQLKAGQQ